MITLSDLRGSVRRAPLTKEKPAPKWRELVNSGEEVVAEVIFADGTTVEVYANCYVHYFNGKNHTTFSLTDVEQDYTYSSLEQASSKIELDYFDKLPWIIRVLMEGDDRVESSQNKARITKNMVSFDTNKDELGTYGCDSEDALAIMLKDELEEMLYQSFLFMTEYQQKIIEACILDNKKHREIASEYGVTRQAISDAFRNGIRRYREAFEKLYSDN